MKRIIPILIIIFTSAMFACAAKRPVVLPTPEELKKVEEAIPADLPVKPKKERKLLVYSQSHGFKHNARYIGEEMLKLMEKKNGVCKVTINNNPEEWTADYVNGFDAICILNATGMEHAFRKEAQRNTILEFVNSGGGIYGIHAATDGGKESWPEYSEMWGGSFGGHPWGKTGTWTIQNRDPENPINKSFNGEGFDINDELYRQKHPYKPGVVHVLTCIDLRAKINTHNPNGELKTVPPDVKAKKGEPKKPKVPLSLKRDHPTSWIKPYGKGRVFYTTFGHNEAVHWNRAIVGHFLRGLQYALGDLEIDDTIDSERK